MTTQSTSRRARSAQFIVTAAIVLCGAAAMAAEIPYRVSGIIANTNGNSWAIIEMPYGKTGTFGVGDEIDAAKILKVEPEGVTMAVEDEAAEEAGEAVEAAEEIKAAAAVEALKALIAAQVIEDEAAQEAVSGLVAAEIIEEEAVEEALAAVLAPDDDVV